MASVVCAVKKKNWIVRGLSFGDGLEEDVVRQHLLVVEVEVVFDEFLGTWSLLKR